MLNRLRAALIDAGEGFMAHECLSRGAAIAYYTLFSLAPLLIISMAIAGFVFGDDAARGAVAAQLRGLLGDQAAEAVQSMVQGASSAGQGTLVVIAGIGFLMLTASGTFSELQSALNVIWKVETPAAYGGAVQAVSRFLRAKGAAIGLVAATGFLLLVSLVASAAVSAFGTWLGHKMPGAALVASLVSFALSFALIAALFAAIYKVLPDRRIDWSDVVIGAVATALMFTIGKYLIGWYIGSGTVASSFGAAGSLAVLLVWIYYSAQIFLLGAEFTRAWAGVSATPAAEPESRRGVMTQPPADLVTAVPAPAPDQVGGAWLAGGALVLLALALRGGRRRA